MPPNEREVEIVIRAKDMYSSEFQALRKELAGLQQGVNVANQEMQGGFQASGRQAGSLGAMLGTLGQQALSAAAGFLIRDVVIGSWHRLRGAIQGVADGMVDANKRWETYQTRFEVQLGSQEAAIRRLKELEEFAIFAPGGLDDLIQADLIMQNFGLHAAEASQKWGFSGREIRQIAADVAAGTSGSFEEVATWLGRLAVGDVGLAITRLQQMGAVTREQLRAMGVEFDKAGAITSPVDQAFAATLELMREKFGGLTQIQSEILDGMQEQAEDFWAQQRRLWGEPVFDLYKSGLRGLLTFLESEGVQEMLGIGRELFAAGVGWLGDMAREWGGWFAQLGARLFNWGANAIDQFAAGIAGSTAVSSALRKVASQITSWLAPGSPPKLLPELDVWGGGAAEAWLEGWADVTPRMRPFLTDMFRSMEPFLRGIDAGKGFDPGALRATFGAQAEMVQPYIASYQRVSRAVQEVAEARDALAEAEEAGDEEAVEAARARLTAAEDEESQARRQMSQEQRRLRDRVAAETKLTQAIQKQTAAITEKERREIAALDAAAAKAEEAEQRAIAQAHLQYRLAVAGTPMAQIPIWEEELAKAEEGSAEWWQIQTRLVQLRRTAAEEQGESLGGAMGGGFSDEFTHTVSAGVEDGMEEGAAVAESQGEKIDWGGIGAAIGGAIRDRIVEEIALLPQRLVIWTESFRLWSETDAQALVEPVGTWIGRHIALGLSLFLGLPTTSEQIGDDTYTMLETARDNIIEGVFTLGLSLGETIIRGMTQALHGQSPEEIVQAALDESAAAAEERRETGHRNLLDWVREAGKAYGEWWWSLPPWISGKPPQVDWVPPGKQWGGWASGWTLVGEAGPEIIDLPAGSKVYPAEQSQRMAGNVVNLYEGAIQIIVGQGTPGQVRIGVLDALKQVGVTS